MLCALLLLLQAEDLRRLAEELEAADIDVRQEAENGLYAAGEAARPFLAAAAAGEGEGALRARTLLRWLDLRLWIPPAVLARDPGLRPDLLSADPERRARGVRNAVLPGGVPPWRILLDDPDPVLRLQAAVALEHDLDGRAGREALDFLRGQGARFPRDEQFGRVSDASSRVCRTALARTEDLLPLLGDPDVRSAGLGILRRLKRWEALPAVLQTPLDAEGEALKFRREAGAPLDLEELLQIVRTRDDGCVSEAARELVERGRKELAEELAVLANEKSSWGAPWALLQAAAQLDLSAAEPMAAAWLEELLAGRRNRERPYQILPECLAPTGKAEHFDRLVRALQLPWEAGGMHFLLLETDKIARPFAAALPPDRFDAVLELCRFESGGYWHAHARRDVANDFGWAMARHLTSETFTSRVLDRVLDPALPLERRITLSPLLRGRPLPAEGVGRILALVADPAELPAYRAALIDVLPWAAPGGLEPRLFALARDLLSGAAKDVRERVLARLWYDAQGELQGLAARTLEADPALSLPWTSAYDWHVPDAPEPRALALRRLESGNPFMFMALLRDPTRVPTAVSLDLLRSPMSERRAMAAALPGPVPADALRRFLAEETDAAAWKHGMDAALRTGDAAAWEEAACRRFPRGSPAEETRLRAVAARGRPEDLRDVEPELRELPPAALRVLLPALARTDVEAAARHVRWALEHADARVRAGGAEAAGVARLRERLDDLGATAAADEPQAAEAAVAALFSFERAEWLPRIRRALGRRWSRALFERLIEAGVPELAPELLAIARGGGHDGAMALAALDASLNPEPRRAWAGRAMPERPKTLEELLTGVPVRWSAGARPLASEPARTYGWDFRRFLGTALSWHMAGPEWTPTFFAAVSDPEGIRVLTLREAVEHWSGRLR